MRIYYGNLLHKIAGCAEFGIGKKTSPFLSQMKGMDVADEKAKGLNGNNRESSGMGRFSFKFH